MQGLIGKKVGMTQIFDKDGRRVAVTVVQVGPCVVVQKKSVEKDGYSAVQLGYGEHKEKGVPKAAINRFKKIGTGPRMWLPLWRHGLKNTGSTPNFFSGSPPRGSLE